MVFLIKQSSHFVFKGVIGAMITSVILLAPNVLSAENHANDWSSKMQGLYKTLADLVTDVTSSNRFNDPANKHRIESEAEEIANLTHDLSRSGMVVPDQDPSVRILASMLGQETRRAVTELKRGNRAYARTILRSIPGYCIACHTRNPSGRQFDRLPIEPTGGKETLRSFEKGEFYAATRQFDRAQAEFIQVINSAEMAKEDALDWSQAVQQGLAIAVRVKRDPEAAMKLVKVVLDSKDAPFFVRQDAEQ
jgi:hypothetical protein